MDYSQKITSIIVTMAAFSFLSLFILKDHLSKLNRSWKKRKFERRKKETYNMLLNELLSGRKWINDYSYENISRHGRVAQLLDIIGHYNTPYDLYSYATKDIANNLNLPSCDQPTMQWGLCIELCKRLDIPISENFIKRRLCDREWEIIAERIGIADFEKRYGKKLPIPFIMESFCDLFHYLKKSPN